MNERKEERTMERKKKRQKERKNERKKERKKLLFMQKNYIRYQILKSKVCIPATTYIWSQPKICSFAQLI